MLTGSVMQRGKKYIVLLLHNKEMLSSTNDIQDVFRS